MLPVITSRLHNGRFLPGTHWRPHRIFREKDYLLREYITNKRSTGDIAAEHGVNPESILHWLKKHCIPRRDAKTSRGRAMNEIEIREYHRLLRMAFPEKYHAARERDKAKNKARAAAYYQRPGVKAKMRVQNRAWRKAHPGYNSQKLRRYREQNPDRYKGYDTKRRAERTVYTRNRRRTDLNFRLASILRGRVTAAIRGKNKSASTMSLLGCSIESFKLYLESKWESGMSWANYGRYPGWQIDHIVPCAIFSLEKPEHQKRCFHFSNMQPMWAVDNLSKSKRPESNQFNLL